MALTSTQLQENVNALIDQGAQDSDIDDYLSSQGTSMADLQKQAQPTASTNQGSNFFSREGDIASNAWEGFKDNAPANPKEGSFNQLGALASVVPQSINNVLGTLSNDDWNEFKKQAPETAQSISNNVSSAKDYIANSDVGNFLKSEGSDAKSLAKAHPESAKFVDSAMNVASAIPVLGTVMDWAKPVLGLAGEGLEAAGTPILASGNAGVQNRLRTAAVDDLQPKATNPTLNNALRKAGIDSETGFINPTEHYHAMVDEALKTPGYDPINGNKISNYNALSDANNAEIESLRNTLDGNKTNVSDFQSGLTKMKKDLKNQNDLPSDVKNARVKVIDDMLSYTNPKIKGDTHIDTSKILDARQSIDEAAKTKNGQLKTKFESDYAGGMQPVRDYANNYLNNQIQNDVVKNSLRRQSLLRTAMNNIGAPAVDEAKVLQKGVTKPNLLERAGTIGNAAKGYGYYEAAMNLLPPGLEEYAPYIAATAGLTMGGAKAAKGMYNAAKAPITRQIIGGSMTGVGKALQGFSASEIGAMTPAVKAALLTSGSLNN